MSLALDDLLAQRRDVWRAGHGSAQQEIGIASGRDELDALLPGHGWPLGAITEILAERSGVGEISLLLPALAQLAKQDRWLAFIGAPHIVYAPALVQAGIALHRCLMVTPRDDAGALWAGEQALRSGACAAVLLWSDGDDIAVLRRLQLAAETGNALCILYRPLALAQQASPAALRLAADGLGFEILKCRGSQWQRGRTQRFAWRHALAGHPSPAPAAGPAR